MCNCRKTKITEPNIPIQTINQPVLDELPFPQSIAEQHAKELKEWQDEQYRKLMNDIDKKDPE